jgi:uncharacterized membrane protein YfcA
MSTELYILLISFFFIALVYSSVGFAGGTSYVALMGVLAIPFQVLRPAALLCNILVATGGTAVFYKENLLDVRKNWPFLVASVPAAFVGGYWPLQEHTFFQLLGDTLIVAAVFLWIQGGSSPTGGRATMSMPRYVQLGVGAGIGFLSGMTSIGGGIFLSPILHFVKWDEARKISAFASLFILVNSVGGLAGQLTRSSEVDWNFIWPLLVAVFLGGQIGSRLGAKTFNPVYIKRITAALILLAGLNILKDHL